MDTPISNSSDPVQSVQGRMADTPHPVSAPFQGFRSLSGMKRSTRYGILLFLMQNSTAFALSEGQRLWIVYYARKLSEAELLKAGRFSESLSQDQVLRQRMKHQIRETHIRVPSLNPIQLPEKRRIGIGYRDKGALRPLHQRRRLGVRAIWDEELPIYLQPLTYEATGRWLTADEVESLVGVDLNLVLSQIRIQSSVHWFETLSQLMTRSDSG